jgi:hypothetical protein
LSDEPNELRFCTRLITRRVELPIRAVEFRADGITDSQQSLCSADSNLQTPTAAEQRKAEHNPVQEVTPEKERTAA